MVSLSLLVIQALFLFFVSFIKAQLIDKILHSNMRNIQGNLLFNVKIYFIAIVSTILD